MYSVLRSARTEEIKSSIHGSVLCTVAVKSDFPGTYIQKTEAGKAGHLRLPVRPSRAVA
jgi:hypothetical protein